MIAAFAVFFALTTARTADFIRCALRAPSVFDATSVKLLLQYGIWPIVLALGLWFVAFGLGRRALRGLMRGPLDKVAAAALGLGLLGQAVFLLGWAGGLRPCLWRRCSSRRRRSRREN
jgi:hypothetical protein